MYRLALEGVAPGEVLAKTVYDDTGRPLLTAGTTLTAAYVQALRHRGLLSVFVRDGLADDVVPSDLVSEQVRATITGHVAGTFTSVALVADERGPGADGVAGMVDRLGERPLELGEPATRAIGELYADVEYLINEVLENDSAAGLESLKTHSSYTFEHSVDVAVVGALLGRRLGLPHDRLRELTLGCLMHDIGKTYIDRVILEKPGPLTGEEFAVIQQHPYLGFELLRRMPFQSLLPAHVSYQHHEKQGGGGYPRGLVGDNTVAGRTAHERAGAGRMLLIAEIGAVADVYSALASDRPYRRALPPDQVAATLTHMAGTHLNREIVGWLRRLVPAYPVGSWVEVQPGSVHAGWRGVVTSVPLAAVDEPSVRLVLDADGEEVADPVELDLRRSPGLRLASLAPGAHAPMHRRQPAERRTA
ncbi:HD-GYP domain-containing protein [Egicoccus halophilus]|uniref:Phosphodiesterase n=1 Tax=Egicoccus halophilus TaxID=1670830 RepID=A0A8J3AFM7_9ACTN|nr:HD-GYP domain-containing protein [Egicoccus halophilus]GGI06937.1 phosphodiesterase [Egicoccus halophilus]